MQPNPQEQSVTDKLFNPRQAFNLMYFLAAGHATCLTVFLRHSFGSEAFRWRGPTALLMILLYAGLGEEPLMVTYFWFWLVALIVQRLKTFEVWRRGGQLHSEYGGYPGVALRIPCVRREGTAKNLEPFLCLLAGAALMPVSEKLGSFISAGFVSLLLTRLFETRAMAVRVRSMRNASIEQRNMAALYRGESRFSDF